MAEKSKDSFNHFSTYHNNVRFISEQESEPSLEVERVGGEYDVSDSTCSELIKDTHYVASLDLPDDLAGSLRQAKAFSIDIGNTTSRPAEHVPCNELFQ